MLSFSLSNQQNEMRKTYTHKTVLVYAFVSEEILESQQQLKEWTKRNICKRKLLCVEVFVRAMFGYVFCVSSKMPEMRLQTYTLVHVNWTFCRSDTAIHCCQCFHFYIFHFDCIVPYGPTPTLPPSSSSFLLLFYYSFDAELLLYLYFLSFCFRLSQSTSMYYLFNFHLDVDLTLQPPQKLTIQHYVCALVFFFALLPLCTHSFSFC